MRQAPQLYVCCKCQEPGCACPLTCASIIHSNYQIPPCTLRRSISYHATDPADVPLLQLLQALPGLPEGEPQLQYTACQVQALPGGPWGGGKGCEEAALRAVRGGAAAAVHGLPGRSGGGRDGFEEEGLDAGGSGGTGGEGKGTKLLFTHPPPTAYRRSFAARPPLMLPPLPRKHALAT